MAFTRPTLRQIIDRIKSDYRIGLGLTAILRRSFLDVFAKAHGGASHTLHGHIDFAINEKFFPDTGDEETVVRWGAMYDVPRKDAVFAEISIEIFGTTGTVLTEDKVYVRSDGVEYLLKDETVVPVAPDSVIATVRAAVADDASNIEDGEKLSLSSSQAGVESEATVVATIIEGEDLEPLAEYRVRVLERMRFPPSGGTANDYVGYAKTVSGVSRAWVLPGNLGEGTVGLAFVEDGNAPASIIPSPAKVDEVQIAVTNLKPISADLTTFAPIEKEINPTIQLKPNTAAVQQAVIDELNDLLAREAQVRDAIDPDQVGLSILFDGKVKLSQINEAISIAAGEVDHTLISPTQDVQPSVGGLVTLGTPVFITLP